MADLTQTILAGTSQISGGMQDLIAARERKTQRKQVALQAMNEAFGEAAKSFREYKSWEAKKAAENDVKQIMEADRLGTISKAGARGGVIGLDAVRPSTVEGYIALTERRAARLKEAQEAAKIESDRLHDLQTQRYNQFRMDTTAEELDIRRGELAVKKAQAGWEMLFPKKNTENVDSLSDYGIQQATKKARALKEIEGSPAPKEPGGLDQKIPDELVPLLEKRWQAPPGSLKGRTYRDAEMLAQDPDDVVIKTLRIMEAQRQAKDYESPELKAARNRLAKIEKELSDFEDKVTFEDARTKMMNGKQIEARRGQLQEQARTAQAEVDALDGDEGEGAAAPVNLGLTPEGQAEYDAMTPEQQAEIRKAMGK